MKVNIMGPYTTTVDYGSPELSGSDRYRRLRDGADLDFIDPYAGVHCNQWGFKDSGVVVRKLAVIFFEYVTDIEKVCKLLRRKGCHPSDHADLLSLIKARHYEPYDDATIIAPNSRIEIPPQDKDELENSRFMAYTLKKKKRKLITLDEAYGDDILENDGVLFRWGADQPLH